MNAVDARPTAGSPSPAAKNPRREVSGFTMPPKDIKIQKSEYIIGGAAPEVQWYPSAAIFTAGEGP